MDEILSFDSEICTLWNLNSVQLWLDVFDMKSLQKILVPACHVLEWQNIGRSGGRKCLCRIVTRWTLTAPQGRMVHPLSYLEKVGSSKPVFFG